MAADLDKIEVSVPFARGTPPWLYNFFS